MTDPVFTRQEGAGRLIVSVPHSGLGLAGLEGRLTDSARRLPDTDWHLPQLYDFLAEQDVTVITAVHSRYVIDLNRDPSGQSLYPGQNVTELCPTTMFDESPIYKAGEAPDQTEIDRRVLRYWHPYHREIAHQIDRVKGLHGEAVLFDAHSIASQVPRFFNGKLPDFNLGTNDGDSCDPALAEAAFNGLEAASGYSAVLNGRFKGGFITRHYGAIDGVHAVQLELSQATYMDESYPYAYRDDLAAKVRPALQQLLACLAAG